MHKNKSRYNNTLATFLLVLLLIYFSYHAISGDRGLIALMNLSKKVEESKNELDIITAERIKFEHKVNLLRDESLDLDLLDERARQLLGYIGEEETVYDVSKHPE